MEDISSMAILQNIFHLRRKRKYSQEYMALQLSISQNAYSKLERGITKLTMDRLQQIAAVFDTTAPDLVRESLECARS